MELFEAKIKLGVWYSHPLFLKASIFLGNYVEREEDVEEKRQRKKVGLIRMSRK